jgi:hypothetical protein
MTGHFRRGGVKTMDLQQYNRERYLEMKRMLKIQSKVTCECGSKSKYAHFRRHLESKMHLNFLGNLNPPFIAEQNH